MTKPDIGALQSPGAAAEEALAGLNPELPLAVAFSGGADSTALLMASMRRWPGQVKALHVHHGIQAAADLFVTHCQAVCSALAVPLKTAYVDARHAGGDSPEDAARRARYTALAALAGQAGCKTVLLGQHADDQVETLLLALSRGAGLPGLASMPVRFEREGATFVRPFLKVPGAQLREWVQQQGQAFLDDPTNTDERFTRNRIRARLLPALDAAFPQFRQTFARSAQHAAQAQVLLTDMAQIDLAEVGSPPVIAKLQTLSRPRQSNVLRHWLLTGYLARPSAAQLEQLLDQVQACTTRGHRIHIKVARGHVVRQGGALAYLASL